jgi:hypothetical protein
MPVGPEMSRETTIRGQQILAARLQGDPSQNVRPWGRKEDRASLPMETGEARGWHTRWIAWPPGRARRPVGIEVRAEALAAARSD